MIEVGIVVAALFLAVVIVVGLSMLTGGNNREPTVSIPGVLIAVVVVLVGVGLAMGIRTVDEGNRGVVTRFGAVTSQTLQPGMTFLTPFVYNVELMDVQSQVYTVSTTAASADLQNVTTEITLNYSLDPAQVGTVYSTMRRDYVNRQIVPSIPEEVKSVTALFSAEELITRRPEVKAQITAALRAKLLPIGIVVEAVNLTDFQFSATFTQSIESKVEAEQEALKIVNKTVGIQEEAAQAVIRAKAERDSAIAAAQGRREALILDAQGRQQARELDAQAEANFVTTVADAQALANSLLIESLGSNEDANNLVRYTTVTKLSDNVRVIIVPSGQDFIFGPEILGNR